MPAIDVAALLKKGKANIKPMNPNFIKKYGAPASTTGAVAYAVLSEIEGGDPNPAAQLAKTTAAAVTVTKSSPPPAPATTTKATITTTPKTTPKSAPTNPATLPSSRPATPTPAKAGAAAAAAQKTATTKTAGKPLPGKLYRTWLSFFDVNDQVPCPFSMMAVEGVPVC